MNIWFALVAIKALNGYNVLDGASGAFVNVAYKAVSIMDFVAKIKSSFEKQDFKVLEIENIESKANLIIDHKEDAEKLELLRDIEQEGYDFSWGVYHTFDDE